MKKKDGDDKDDKDDKEDKEDKKEANKLPSDVAAAISEITEVLPEIVAALQGAAVTEEKNASLEDANHTRIRTIALHTLAQEMADINMIREDEIDAYASGLADASDDEIKGVKKTVAMAREKAPKIAEAIARKSGMKVEALSGGKPIMSSIPGATHDRTEADLKQPIDSKGKGKYVKHGIDWTGSPSTSDVQVG